jgi:ubiquinone/menaquinone biosynthesis C-methylase UbiE
VSAIVAVVAKRVNSVYNMVRMSVAAHLGIRLDEYDARIRTFIPRYQTMLDVAAEAFAGLGRRSPVVVDLGTGSGALSARCLSRVPSTRIVGIDEDEGMLDLARQRLGPRLTAVTGSFLSQPLPRCDAIVASFALHHVATPALKSALYKKCFAALKPGGRLVNADCFLAPGAAARARHHAAWRRHLMRTYSRVESSRFLRTWAKEDTYFTLADELELLRAAGFTTAVHWRRASFAVISGTRAARSKSVGHDHKHRRRDSSRSTRQK